MTKAECAKRWLNCVPKDRVFTMHLYKQREVNETSFQTSSHELDKRSNTKLPALYKTGSSHLYPTFGTSGI
jgi:hypothetical protein